MANTLTGDQKKLDKDKDGDIDEKDLKAVREGLKRGGKGNVAKKYPGSKAASDARQTLSGMTIPEDTGRNGKNAGGKVKKKGMAMGGMAKKKKGMAAGGMMKKKKGYAMGGMSVGQLRAAAKDKGYKIKKG